MSVARGQSEICLSIFIRFVHTREDHFQADELSKMRGSPKNGEMGKGNDYSSNLSSRNLAGRAMVIIPDSEDN